MDPEDFQPFFEIVVTALGAEELLRRAKQWLVKASKARAREEAVKCSKIIQAIMSHPNKHSTTRQQVSEPLPKPHLPSDQIPLSVNARESLLSRGTAAAESKATPPLPHIPALPVDIPSSKSNPSHAYPLSPTQVSPSVYSPTAPREPQPFPLDIPQAAHLPRSPERPSASLPPSPMHQPHNAAPHVITPSMSNILPPPLVTQNQSVLAGDSPQAKADRREQTTSGSQTDQAAFPLPTDVSPRAEDLLNPETSSPNALNDVGNQQTAPPTIVSLDKTPLEPEVLRGNEAVEQEDSTEEEVMDPVTAVSSANPWDAETNAERVEQWGLEDMIHNDPRHTSPFRTQWMYQDRKEAVEMNDTEYKTLTDQEYSRLADIPPAVRRHTGLVYNKKSKFDWEVRVVLGRLAYDYNQMDEPENSKFLHDSLLEIESRFPDISPTHMFRQIDRDGPKAVQKWRSDVAKWVQTTAGKMGSTQKDLEHHVEILDSKKSFKKFDAYKLLGLGRAEINYVAWGRTSEGKRICNPIIDKEMEEWKAVPENQAKMAKDSKAFGQRRVTVQARVRRLQFEGLTKEEKKEVTEKLKTKDGVNLLTEDDIQAATECLLSHLTQVVSHSADIVDLHIVLFASGVISGSKLPVIMKEFGVKPNQGPFLDGQEVGGRAKAEYPNYVSARFQADPSELVVLDQGLGDTLTENGDEHQLSKSKSKGKGKGKAVDPGTGSCQPSHPVLSQWKPSANVNTNNKRSEYMNRFFANTFKLHFPSKISWNKVSAENDRYIEPQRRPQDSSGQPVQLMNPLAMPVETHLNPWWDFMQDCVQGRVSVDRVFGWKPESTRLLIPSIPVPADPNVHIAGELSRTANPKKRPRGEKKVPRKSAKRQSQVRPASEEPESEFGTDSESLEEDTERPGQDDGPSSARILRNRPVRNVPSVAVQGASESDVEEESGTSGSEFEPEGASQPKGRASTSLSSPRASDNRQALFSYPTPLTSLPCGAEDAECSTPEKNHGPKSSDSPSINVGPPHQLPLFEVTPASPQFTPPSPIEAITQSPPHPTTIPRTCPSPPASLQPPTIAQTCADPSSSTLNSSNGITLTSEDHPSRASGSPTLPANATAAPSSKIDSVPTNLPSNPSANLATSSNPTSATSSGDLALSPTLPLAFRPLRLVHPRMFSGEAAASGNPAWLQVKPLWELWGHKVALLNVDQRNLSLSPSSPRPDVTLPSALTSAMSITQIYLALQRGDPHLPEMPMVRVSPTCHLDALHPHHHIRQAVEGIFDVQVAPSTGRVFEGNMPLGVEAVHAFFGVLEGSLASFIEQLTSNEQILRYAEVDFFTSLRLAICIKGTTLMRDEGDSGPSIQRVESLLDRLVSVLAGIAVLRYMQEYLGGALARWTREQPDKSGSRWEMWYSFWQMWKAGMSGLASALSQGRQDLFQYRGIYNVISPSVKSIVDHLMANPAWWSAPGDGIPVAFCLSQESDSSELLRSSVVEDSVSLVELFTSRCRDLKQVIEDSFRREDGPKYGPDTSDSEVRRRKMVEAWVKVWQSEGGPDGANVPSGTSANPSWDQDTRRIPLEIPEPMDLDELEGAPASREDESTPNLAEDLPPSPEDDDAQPNEEEEGSKSGAEISTAAGVKRKRKVPVGGRRIAEPSIGLAEDPRRRLKELAAKAPEKEIEDRPRRRAYLKSPYVGSTHGQALHVISEQDLHSAIASSSKKPKAATAKSKAAAKASAPSSSPAKLTRKSSRVQASKKVAETKAAKSRATGR
ncbi:hypothetical protein FRC01_005833 [Tulasnella sp. 417]|nr:hypothetical protein FRC01_005833 [Tulasnella sp. 417]